MPRSTSGRIVVELHPQLKRRLYAALTRDGQTLKDWFTQQAEAFVAADEQPSLPLASSSTKSNSIP